MEKSGSTGEGRIPVHLVTGFLGAGKTTLLNRLLAGESPGQSAVIVNEFGAQPLDHHLMQAGGNPVFELADGCICCSLQSSIADTLQQLLEAASRSAGAPALSRVWLETTGLADPLPVLQTLDSLAGLDLPFERGSVICVAGAGDPSALSPGRSEPARQVAAADVIIVSQLDRQADPATALAQTAAALGRINPAAPVLDPDTFCARFCAGETFTEALHPGTPRETGTHAGQALHSHDHAHHKGHDHDRIHGHSHVSGVRSLSFFHDQPITPASLEAFLELVTSAHGGHVLRMKGLVAIAGEERPAVVQTVGRLASEPQFLPDWPDEGRQSWLTVICEGIDPALIRALFLGFAGKPQPDMPDLAGHRDNPLAIPGTGRRG